MESEEQPFMGRLPNGAITHCADCYLRAWHDKGDKLTSVIGGKVVAFGGAGFQILADKNRSWNIPMDLANAIIEGQTNE